MRLTILRTRYKYTCDDVVIIHASEAKSHARKPLSRACMCNTPNAPEGPTGLIRLSFLLGLTDGPIYLLTQKIVSLLPTTPTVNLNPPDRISSSASSNGSSLAHDNRHCFVSSSSRLLRRHSFDFIGRPAARLCSLKQPSLTPKTHDIFFFATTDESPSSIHSTLP